MNILVVEDDEELAGFVAAGLREHGHAVEVCPDGREGFILACSDRFDVLVLDRMLPGLEGVALAKAVRAAGHDRPILLLTAVGGIDDRVEGLEAGADDYLVKPFAFAELLARLNALGRRPARQVPETGYKVADLELDLLRRSVLRAGRRIDLQPREFDLLAYLMRHAGRVVTRTMLLEQVWNFHFDPKTNIVETHISRLRSKIDRAFDVELLHTVRGAGYVLRESRADP
jgi:two-component system OmpR family response regulator